jgi:hypothetical protein
VTGLLKTGFSDFGSQSATISSNSAVLTPACVTATISIQSFSVNFDIAALSPLRTDL